MGSREQGLGAWVGSVLASHAPDVGDDFAIRRISGDASFRAYYRVTGKDGTWIAVDAPPGQEDSRLFVDVAQLLGTHGLNVPRVHAFDLEQGFMLLSDLGDDLYLDRLDEPREATWLYSDAIAALVRFQSITPEPGLIPPYDRGRLTTEMNLFPDWLLTRQLGLRLSRTERELLARVFELLIANAEEQPQVLVHRDYHSRNLMVCGANNPGIVDFQDAVIGAVSYDLVSLLRDCYVEWPEARVRDWITEYLSAAGDAGVLQEIEESRFVRWFDLMGLQRHIKVAGIFCRLHLRDGKEIYLHDVPLVMKYILTVAARYAELDEFVAWLGEAVLPRMAEHASIFRPFHEKLGEFL